MYKTAWIAGYECNLCIGKTGRINRVCVMVGPDDKPGWRSKDGPEAQERRRAARDTVRAALASDPTATLIIRHPRRLTVAARYSCLSVAGSGWIERRNEEGQVIGVYEP